MWIIPLTRRWAGLPVTPLWGLNPNLQQWLTPASRRRQGLAVAHPHHRALATLLFRPKPTTSNNNNHYEPRLSLSPLQLPASGRTFHSTNQNPSPESDSARSPLRIIIPVPSPESIEAMDTRFGPADRPDKPVIDPQTKAAILRIVSMECFVTWIHANFPKMAGYLYHPMGYFKWPITFTDTSGATASFDHKLTELIMISRDGDMTARVDGKKQGGIVCMALYAVPPEGVGEPDTPSFHKHGTPAMVAAEKALERYMRELQGIAYKESGALCGDYMEGCLGIVSLGSDMGVSEYTAERGFYDPPGGLVEEQRLMTGEELGYKPLWEEPLRQK